MRLNSSKLFHHNFYNSTFFIILVFGILIRFYNIEGIPPPIHPDEAFMGQSAISILERSKNLLETYFSTTIASNTLTAFFIKLFGIQITTLRMQSIFFGVATNVLLYLLAKDLFNKRLAFILFFLGTFSHLAIAYSRINIPPIQAPFFLVIVLYLINLAITRNKAFLFLLGGLSAGLSLYSYTGSKIALAAGLTFLCLHYKMLNWKKWFFFFFGLLLVALPLALYIAGPNNYLQRESEVTLFTKPAIFYARWETNDAFTIFYQQFKTNFWAFINIKDNSNQYGNGALLDNFSSIFFLLFFILFTFSLFINIKRTSKNIINLSFFTFIFFFIISLVSLTKSPPLSTRLLILYPIVLLFISWTLDIIYIKFTHINIILAKSVIYSILLIIFVLNIKIYFYDYTTNKNAYYNWIEPTSSIAFYIRSLSPEVDVYLVSNPHTYVIQPIISVLAYKRANIYPLSTAEDVDSSLNKPSNVEIIIPLVPKSAIESANPLREFILKQTATDCFVRKIYKGIPYKNSKEADLFEVISKVNINCSHSTIEK